MPQKHYSCRGYFSRSMLEPRSQQPAQPPRPELPAWPASQAPTHPGKVGTGERLPPSCSARSLALAPPRQAPLQHVRLRNGEAAPRMAPTAGRWEASSHRSPTR